MKKLFSSKKSYCFTALDIITSAAVGISLSFTIFFFSPADIFLGNQKDFAVGASTVILPLLITAIVSSAVLFLVTLLTMKSRSAFMAVTNILFGFLLAFYIQMLFFNGSTQLIGVQSSDYDDLNFRNIFNAVLMFVIVILPLLLSTIRDSAKDNKTLNFAKGKILPYISILIFIMQLCGTLNLLITNGLLKDDKSRQMSYLSYEPAASFSKEDNIVVFLMDSLDSVWMDEMLETYPELYDELKGFTYYQNNVSRYNKTFPSIPSMLSGCEYGGEKWEDYLSKVWSGDTLPEELHNNGYEVNLLIDSLTTYNDLSQIGFCDNIRNSNVRYKGNYLGKGGVIPTMTGLSFVKLSPYLIKSFFNTYTADLSNDFIVLPDQPDRMRSSVGPQTDIDFYNYMKDKEFTDDSERKTFSFIHFNGTHDYWKELSELDPSFDPDSDKPTKINSGRGTFEAALTYMRKMKELGVYDNSTIIIIADHGRLEEHNTAALLIKPKNAELTDLRLDTDSELSNVNFYASVLEYAGIDHSAEGISYNDIINGGLHPVRYHRTFHFEDFGSLEYLHEYEIKGNARDFNNWSLAEQIS